MPEKLLDVFNEYTRLRINGLDVSEAVRALHPYISDFDSDTRNALAGNLRAWESKRTEIAPDIDREVLKRVASGREADKTGICPECGMANDKTELICYSCGYYFDSQASGATDLFQTETNIEDQINDALFKPHYLLRLKPLGDHDEIILHPANGNGQITIGRGAHQEDGSIAHIDLQDAGQATGGISRIHATIIYNDTVQILTLMDAGSTNGTFLNSQRLHENERRTIRHGDTLRFARLEFSVEFQTLSG